jgi:hypothetical protein
LINLKKFDDKMTENNREPVPQPKYIPSYYFVKK